MRFRREESGQSTVLMAVFMGLLMLGFLALALDVGYLFQKKRSAQSAADAAVVAAAEEGGTTTAAQTAANAVAARNGFDTADYPVQLTTSGTGIYSNAAGASSPGGWLTATVSQPFHTFFLSAFMKGMSNVTVSSSAMAGLAVTPACVCLTSTLNMSNNAKLNASGCAVGVNSNAACSISVTGGASVCAKSVGSESTTWDTSSCINNAGSVGGSSCPSTVTAEGAAACVLPPWNPPALPNGLPCYANPINGWTAANNYTAIFTLPMAGETVINNTVCYTSLDTSDSASVTFSPGYTYYIQGNFSNGGGAPVSGSNVTFYVGGNLNWGNGVTTVLSAPTVNGVPGTLFYVNGATVTIAGGNNSNLSGILDAPNAAVTLNNGTSTTGMNLDIDAQSLTMTGGATLTTYAQTAPAGAAGGTLDQ